MLHLCIGMAVSWGFYFSMGMPMQVGGGEISCALFSTCEAERLRVFFCGAEGGGFYSSLLAFFALDNACCCSSKGWSCS